MKSRITTSLAAVAALLLAFAAPAWAQPAIIIPGPIPATAPSCTIQRNSGDTAWVCQAAVGASQPLTDGSGLIADNTTPSKILAFELVGLSANTTRTWTISDANITIPSTIASLATNTFTGLQTLNGGLSATTATFSSTLGVTGTSTLGVVNAGAVTSTGSVVAAAAVNKFGTDTTAYTQTNVVRIGNGTAEALGVAGTGDTVNQNFYATGLVGRLATLQAIVSGTNGGRFKIFTKIDGGLLTERMDLSAAGVLTVNALASGNLTSASGVITSSSDERLKDISGPLSYGLSEVLALKPIRYHWNALSGVPVEPEYGGFGAAQVETFMPLAVSYGADGMRGLNTTVILGAAVNAIQQIETRLRAVEANARIVVSPTPIVSATKIQQEIVARKAADQAVRDKRAADTKAKEIIK